MLEKFIDTSFLNIIQELCQVNYWILDPYYFW